jgi:hypothetical protein
MRGVVISEYYDSHGRIHEKKDKISNNGWIYTAYSKKVGMKIDLAPATAYSCVTMRERHPFHSSNPPISFDEILGLAYLEPRLIDKEMIKTFSYVPRRLQVPKFNLIQFLKEVHLCFKNRKDRNYFWREEKTQIYRFAFKIPLIHRHFFLKCVGKYNLLYHLIHILDMRIYSKDRSARAIKFLKGSGDTSAMVNYFGPEHPISKKVMQ